MTSVSQLHRTTGIWYLVKDDKDSVLVFVQA